MKNIDIEYESLKSGIVLHTLDSSMLTNAVVLEVVSPEEIVVCSDFGNVMKMTLKFLNEAYNIADYYYSLPYCYLEPISLVERLDDQIGKLQRVRECLCNNLK